MPLGAHQLGYPLTPITPACMDATAQINVDPHHPRMHAVCDDRDRRTSPHHPRMHGCHTKMWVRHPTHYTMGRKGYTMGRKGSSNRGLVDQRGPTIRVMVPGKGAHGFNYFKELCDFLF